MKIKCIGKYKVQEIVGEGSFGKVYKGVDQNNKEVVALKFMDKKGKKLTELDGLRSETEMLQKIKHQNVIGLKQIIETPKQLIIVMQFAETDLSKTLQKRKKFPYQEVKIYGKQMLSALLYLKENRIIHRDLKPQNILVNNNKLKLCDFGFAKKLAASTTFLNSIKGTPLYIAPEIIKHKPYNHKVDIWSFGIILYEMFVGRTPFHCTVYNKLIPRILHSQVPFPTDMPLEMKQLIGGMLQKDASKRYDWQQVAKHPFFKQQETLQDITSLCNNKKKISQQQDLKESIVIMKIQGQNDLKQIEFIYDDIHTNKNGKYYRLNQDFYYKVISILGLAVTEPDKISKDILQKILDILKSLIKVKLNISQHEDDILKNIDLIFSLIKLGQNEQNNFIVEQQLVLIGYFLKNNFNSVQIDFQTDQQVIKFVSAILKKKKSPTIFSNCLKVIGILTSQAMCTLNNSFEFFERIVDQHLLTTITEYYEQKPQFSIILQLLQKFVHFISKPPIDPTIVTPSKMHLTLYHMKHQIASILEKQNKFITDISPLQIFKGPEIDTYINVLYESLKVSPKLRQQYATKKYWNDVLNSKKVFCLANNQLLLENKQNLITKQSIQNYIVSENKLFKVYILSLGHYNLTKKSSIQTKQQMAKTIIAQINQLFQISDQAKFKCCRQLQGSLTQLHLVFDDVLVNIICELVEENLIETEYEISQKLIDLININEQQKHCNISYMTLSKVFKIIEPHCRNSKKFSSFIMQLFNITINHHILKYIIEVYGRQFYQNFIVQLLTLTRISQENIICIAQNSQQNGFYRMLFDHINQQYLVPVLGFMNKIMLKCTINVMDFVAIQVLPKLNKFIDIKHTSIDLILEIVQIITLLARQKQQYNKHIEQTGIVYMIPSYLAISNQLLQERTLTMIGNLAKYSTYFFDEFFKYNILKFQLLKNSKKVVKNFIYAVGNISFYNQRFYKDIKVYLNLFKENIQNGQENTMINTLSAITNFLRYSNIYLNDLQQLGLIESILHLILQNTNKNRTSYYLNFLKKGIIFPQFIEKHRSILKKIYEKRKEFNQSHQIFKKLRQKLNI